MGSYSVDPAGVSQALSVATATGDELEEALPQLAVAASAAGEAAASDVIVAALDGFAEAKEPEIKKIRERLTAAPSAVKTALDAYGAGDQEMAAEHKSGMTRIDAVALSGVQGGAPGNGGTSGQPGPLLPAAQETPFQQPGTFDMSRFSATPLSRAEGQD